MDNTNQHYINKIQEQKKLKKITKHDTQYTKISTSDEGTFDALELQIEKEIPITSSSISPTITSTKSSIVISPDVPPYSSTTIAI